MRFLRAQYFLSYAVLGSLMPYLSAYFEQRGLSRAEIGQVFTAASLAMLLTPVVVTWLADARVDARRILAGLFGTVGVTALLLGVGEGAGWAHAATVGFLVAGYALHSVMFSPIMPLQDGVNFALQQQRRARGEAPEPYHHVRVWGTIGFILPSAVLWLLLPGRSLGWTLVVCAGFCVLGMINALLLPDPRLRMLEHPEEALPAGARLPTVAAAKALLEPHVLVFCLAMGLVHMAAAAYYAFYPIYLTSETVGIEVGRRWLGPIANLGQLVEIVFVLGYGWLIARFGVKKLMTVGVGAMAVRLALLAAAPSVVVGVGTQLFHGLMVLVIHVAPPLYLNSRAGPAYRHSIQGVFAVAVMGVGRVVGNLVAGYVAHASLLGVFAYAAGLCGAAAGLFAFAFHERSDKRHATRDK